MSGSVNVFGERRRHRGFFGVIIATLALVLGLIAAPAVASATPVSGVATASPVVMPAFYHPNLNITKIGKDSKYGTITVCKDWHHSTWKSRYCTGSPWKKLYQNQNSKRKYGWADVDAVYVRHNHKLKERFKVARDTTGHGISWVYVYSSITSCNRGHGYYQKVQPNSTWPNNTSYYYQKKC